MSQNEDPDNGWPPFRVTQTPFQNGISSAAFGRKAACLLFGCLFEGNQKDPAILGVPPMEGSRGRSAGRFPDLVPGVPFGRVPVGVGFKGPKTQKETLTIFRAPEFVKPKGHHPTIQPFRGSPAFEARKPITNCRGKPRAARLR